MSKQNNYYVFINLVVIALLILLFSCKEKPNEPEDTVLPNTYIEIKDFKYGEHPLQAMDIYLQENRNLSTPLVILVHGGSWVGGDKSQFNLNPYLKAGMNVVNINYRLANGQDILCEEIITDIHSAVSAVRANTKRWNIRSGNYILWGNSAGGHLSQLYAHKYDANNVISAVVSFGGPTKLDDIESFDLEQHYYLLLKLTGKPWNGGELPEVYRNYSPYYAGNYKPSFLIHGEKDALVPLRQAVLMQQKLTERGVDNDIFILSNAGHSGEGAPDKETQEVILKSYEWILKYSK